MEPKDILEKYGSLAKSNQQLNVAAFTKMYGELKSRITDPAKLEKVTEIYNSRMSMRDGCEINSRSIADAIHEMEPALS